VNAGALPTAWGREEGNCRDCESVPAGLGEEARSAKRKSFTLYRRKVLVQETEADAFKLASRTKRSRRSEKSREEGEVLYVDGSMGGGTVDDGRALDPRRGEGKKGAGIH